MFFPLKNSWTNSLISSLMISQHLWYKVTLKPSGPAELKELILKTASLIFSLWNSSENKVVLFCNAFRNMTENPLIIEVVFQIEELLKWWIAALPILSSPWTQWSMRSLILFNCNLLFLSMITLWKYLVLESPSSNQLILNFCFRMESCTPSHMMYCAWTLLRAYLDWLLLFRVSCSSSSCILASHNLTLLETFSTSSLDHWVNFLLSSLGFCWSLHIGLPVMWVDHTCSTKFMKEDWSAQKFKNLTYLIHICKSFSLLTRIGLWSDPVLGRWFTIFLE